MHRGFVSTLATSEKMARERSAGSEIAANADGGCKVLEGWAEPDTDAATIMQHSKAMADPDCMGLMSPTGDNCSRLQKFISPRQDSKSLEFTFGRAVYISEIGK
jgi:hypothetical protein